MSIKITKEQRIVNDVAGDLRYEIDVFENGYLGKRLKCYMHSLSTSDMKELREALAKLDLQDKP